MALTASGDAIGAKTEFNEGTDVRQLGSGCTKDLGFVKDLCDRILLCCGKYLSFSLPSSDKSGRTPLSDRESGNFPPENKISDYFCALNKKLKDFRGLNSNRNFRFKF